MKKLFFILSIFGILLLMFIGSLKEFQEGIVQNIKSSPLKTTIILHENKTQLIIFDSNINLKIDDKINFKGKENIYKGQKQIIIDKINIIKE